MLTATICITFATAWLIFADRAKMKKAAVATAAASSGVLQLEDAATREPNGLINASPSTERER